MRRDPTPEQIARLPKWAREHVADLTRERDEANKMLAGVTDDQSPSPFYTDDFRGTEPSTADRSVRRYFQAHRLTVEFGGVYLTVLCREAGSNSRTDCIDLTWDDQSRGFKEVVCQPTAFQQLRLYRPERGTEP